MSNFVFSRRALQQVTDRLASVLAADQLAPMVDRLNRMGGARLPAMWELVMLDALSGVGILRHEVELPNGRRPDFELAVPQPDSEPVLVVGDIATISDAGLDEQNPVQALSEEVSRLARKSGLNPNHFGYDVRGQRVGTYRDARMKLLLPAKGALLELMRREVTPWIHRLKAAPHQPDRFDYTEGAVAFSLTYSPGQTGSVGSHLAYDIAASRDKNPLFAALKAKAGQLRQAPVAAVRLIIACDGDSALLRQSSLMPSPGTFTAREVAQDFLRQNSSIDAVLLATVDEQRSAGGAMTYRMKCELVVAPARARSPRVPPDAIAALDRVLPAALGRVPRPVQSAYNAAIRCRELPYGPDMIGGYVMNGDRVSLSARALQRLLAGEITSDEFIAAHGWNEGEGPSNPFARMARSGRMIAGIEVESAGEQDDDWLTFRFGPPDPAAGPFRVPDAVSPSPDGTQPATPSPTNGGKD